MTDYIPTMDVVKLQHLDRIKETMNMLNNKMESLNSNQNEYKKSISQLEMLVRATSACAYKTYQALDRMNEVHE